MSQDEDLFVREATGLVRDWSSYDAWIYAFLSVNIVTLGFYIWTFNSFIPDASPILGTIIAVVVLTLQNVVYATLVSSMPRVGGDYVWESRLLSGFWGFVGGWPGWVFSLWLWVPIYGSILSWLVFGPISALFGYPELAQFWNSPVGLFISAMIVIPVVSIYVGLGMKWYARIQKTLFYLGIVGLALLVWGLLTTNPAEFQTAFNAQMGALVPAQDITYQGILGRATASFAPLWNLNWAASYALIPMLFFWIMYPVWGATLFGEVRESGEWGKMFGVFEAALVAAGVAAILFWLLFDSAFSYEFYQSLNSIYFVGSGDLQWLSSPTLLAAIAMGNGPLAKLMAVLMAAWFFAWSGTIFLSSTRVIFATAFDRTAPEFFADLKTRFNAPIYALLAMVIPGIAVAVLYYFVPGFSTLTLDAAFAIAITFFATTIACMIFPLRRPELFSQNPVADYEIFGIPVVSIVAGAWALILLSVFWLWATRDVYGVNNLRSAGFMIFLYILAGALYFGMRYYRRQEGVELEQIHSEIPRD